MLPVIGGADTHNDVWGAAGGGSSTGRGSAGTVIEVVSGMAVASGSGTAGSKSATSMAGLSPAGASEALSSGTEETVLATEASSALDAGTSTLLARGGSYSVARASIQPGCSFELPTRRGADRATDDDEDAT